MWIFFGQGFDSLASTKFNAQFGCHLKQMDVMHDIWSFLIKSSPNLDVNKFENDCY